jgi:glutathione S-transferase
MNAPHSFDLQMSRFIRAPRDKVFDAFVTRDALVAWMCPRGMRIPEAEVDARVGGRYRITMRARDGSTFMVGGTYREIARPRRLVMTWQWEGGGMPELQTLIAVNFSEADGGTRIELQHSGFPDVGLRDAHSQGWGSTFSRLTDLLDERGSAASVTLLGDPRSTYTRTARMGLAEKGVAYTLERAAPRTPGILAVHPFGRIPGFRDGDLALFETSAILRYIDESFDGPALLPGTIRDRARCEQWVSAVNAYLYDTMVRRYVLQYVIPRGPEGKPDRGVIDPALAEIEGHLRVLEQAYGGRDYLVGNTLCMADLFLAPILACVEAMPEGAQLLAACPNVRRGQAAVRERASFKATEPPRA